MESFSFTLLSNLSRSAPPLLEILVEEIKGGGDSDGETWVNEKMEISGGGDIDGGTWVNEKMEISGGDNCGYYEVVEISGLIKCLR
ncbi:hypothetical protein Pcinc_034496 [Petrolisthes cinctipes]|uniref:Uncharacterized protein n=1 Tax=Petrolisthes cinctipes TaxID=88211 RepID=A0AAE1JX82_PETCI|nr:hypothetical protein Pcinc_034496 [Petrolisthes cinctipes]